MPAMRQDINSPLRHVRTRIYFTSESHMHSLINVLRFCHLQRACLCSHHPPAVSFQQIRCSTFYEPLQVTQPLHCCRCSI